MSSCSCPLDFNIKLQVVNSQLSMTCQGFVAARAGTTRDIPSKIAVPASSAITGTSAPHRRCQMPLQVRFNTSCNQSVYSDQSYASPRLERQRRSGALYKHALLEFHVQWAVGQYQHCAVRSSGDQRSLLRSSIGPQSRALDVLSRHQSAIIAVFDGCCSLDYYYSQRILLIHDWSYVFAIAHPPHFSHDWSVCLAHAGQALTMRCRLFWVHVDHYEHHVPLVYHSPQMRMTRSLVSDQVSRSWTSIFCRAFQ
eukprot:865947-Pleurochrysis_carterae.AAC.4